MVDTNNQISQLDRGKYILNSTHFLCIHLIWKYKIMQDFKRYTESARKICHNGARIVEKWYTVFVEKCFSPDVND